MTAVHADTPPDAINTIIFTALFSLGQEEYDQELARYQNWLEEYGGYGRLYMWSIGRRPRGQGQMVSDRIGVRIFDSEIAILFRIQFGLEV